MESFNSKVEFVDSEGKVLEGNTPDELSVPQEDVYKRQRVEEVHHAKEEGVIFNLLTNPVEILTDENDWVKGRVVRKMELGEPDASGRKMCIRDSA